MGVNLFSFRPHSIILLEVTMLGAVCWSRKKSESFKKTGPAETCRNPPDGKPLLDNHKSTYHVHFPWIRATLK